MGIGPLYLSNSCVCVFAFIADIKKLLLQRVVGYFQPYLVKGILIIEVVFANLDVQSNYQG